MNNRFSAAASLALIGMLLVTGVTIVPMSATAQESEESFLSGAMESIEDEDGDGHTYDDTGAALGTTLMASLSRVGWEINRNILNRDAEQSASQEAEDLTQAFNSNSTAYEEYSWLQKNTNASTEHDTIRVTLTIDEETATRYITANVSNGNYTDLTMVNSTSRTVDDTVNVCGLAAEQSTEELNTFTAEWAKPDKKPSTTYKAELAGRYQSEVSSSLAPTSGSCEVSS